MEPDINLFAGYDPEDQDLITMDGYDDCIVGVVTRFGSPPIVCYDRDKIIQRHMDNGMTLDESEEFFEFNQAGAWVGDSTPCFIDLNGKYRPKEKHNAKEDRQPAT